MDDVKNRLCAMALAFLMIFAASAHAAGPVKIAVVPFAIHAEKDLSFLKDGIFEMFAFRLAKEGKVAVITKKTVERAAESFSGTLNEAHARDIGSRLDADYVLFGSLTVFGNSVSINAKLTDVSGRRPSLSFFEQTQGMDQVIPKISQFVADITDNISFVPQQTVSKAPPQPVPPAPPKKQAQEETPNPAFKQTVSKASPQPVPSDAPVPPKKQAPEEVPNPAFIVAQPRETAKELWKSQPFSHLINAMALGDVDGDGKTETVILGPRTLHVYRAENDAFHKVKEITYRYKHFIGADIGDVNGNGYPEIFVTSLNIQRTGIQSFVLEWNGGDYVEIVKESGWYYRIAEIPGRGPLLLGQKNTSESPFSGKIFEMKWKGASYAPGEPVTSAKWNNLMGFTIGDLMNKGETLTAAYDKNDHIRLISRSGEVIWKGGDKYGGSMRYCLLPKVERGTDNRQYLPMRLLVTDIDADGKKELITAKNYDIAYSLLKTFRKFTKTQIVSLFWDGIGLAANWKTQETSGHISDIAVGDFDNDGVNELVAALILKDGDIIGTTPQSVVIAYDLK